MKCNGANECLTYLISRTCYSDASSCLAKFLFMHLPIILPTFIGLILFFSLHSSKVKLLGHSGKWEFSLSFLIHLFVRSKAKIRILSQKYHTVFSRKEYMPSVCIKTALSYFDYPGIYSRHSRKSPVFIFQSNINHK